MPTPPLSQAKRSEIAALLKRGLKYAEIVKITGTSLCSVNKVKVESGIEAEPPKQHIDNFTDEIRKALKRGPATAEELADALDCSPKRIRERIEAERSRGVLITELLDGSFDLATPEFAEKTVTSIQATTDEWNHRFGIVSDNHLCNKHSRLDVLNAAYDHFERVGITKVLNAGNMIDGEHRFTRPECIVRPGMDAQVDYLCENYPQRKGIETLFIAGDDHEGWYQQRECIEIGRYMQMRAEAGGRHDLHYLGYAEADIKLTSPGGSIAARLVHPGGGSAYAISYTDQKRVESYQGGEKPQIEIAGHYHKYNVAYPREVFTAQAACTCDQTLFMRKKRLQAMVGFLTLEVQQDRTDGHLIRLRHEWFPFYNRACYEKRYA